MYTFSYVTTEGIVKKINQDSLLIKRAAYKGSELLLAVVCDGIGGLSGGETASSFVVSGLSYWFGHIYPDLLKSGKNILDIRSELDSFIHQLNDDINNSSEPDRTMGTTMTGMLMDSAGGSVLIAHVGDTRLYRIYDDRLEVLTSDHSVVAEEVRRGIITEAEARNDKRQNQITNCIGAGEKGRVYDYLIEEIEENCTYMLCSDGFRKAVTEGEILSALSPTANRSSEEMKKNLDRLLSLNIERRESDNITALTVRYTKE